MHPGASGWAGKSAVSQPNDTSLISGTHRVEGEKWPSHILSSDPPRQVPWHVNDSLQLCKFKNDATLGLWFQFWKNRGKLSETVAKLILYYWILVFKIISQQGVVQHACNACTWEPEAVLGALGLHSAHSKTCFKIKIALKVYWILIAKLMTLKEAIEFSETSC